LAFPARSLTENDPDAVKLDVTITSFAAADEVPVRVQTVGEVCCPESVPVKFDFVKSLSVTVVQSMASFPVTVKKSLLTRRSRQPLRE
jgi:hypothetical protein